MTTLNNASLPSGRQQVSLRKRWWRQQTWSAYLYMLPFLILFTLFYVYPIFQGLYISLTSWDLITPQKYIGFQNYTNLLSDKQFWTTLRNTAYFTALNVPLAILVPLGLALLVNAPIRGQGIFRTVFSVPMMISVSAIAIIWRWFYDPTSGITNYYLELIGIQGRNWLTDINTAMPAIVIADIWWRSGWNMTLFMAGLQEIPEELYDAAKIDGAGGWNLFRYITLPGLQPTTLFIAVTTVIGSFRVFAIILQLTGGGPFESTRSVVQNLYETAFQFFKMGKASAIAWILFAIVLVFTILQFRLSPNPTE
ncbi:MAG: sugar ABC transporter permease [Anaerolineae bacterium]|nr:sugar ABC transporter permease [Anaerolineae bacterium]